MHPTHAHTLPSQKKNPNYKKKPFHSPVGSLKDLLYKRRMERQLAAARGLISGPELPPEEDGPAAPPPPKRPKTSAMLAKLKVPIGKRRKE